MTILCVGADGIQCEPSAKDQRVKALAVTSATRSSQYPELPTLAESGLPGFDTAIFIAEDIKKWRKVVEFAQIKG